VSDETPKADDWKEREAAAMAVEDAGWDEIFVETGMKDAPAEPAAEEAPEPETPAEPEAPEPETETAAEADPAPAQIETETETETPAEVRARLVLAHRFLHEDRELDIEEVFADEAKLAEFRRTYQLGLNQDRNNEKDLNAAVEAARQETTTRVNQNTIALLDESGMTLIPHPSQPGKYKVVPKNAPTTAPAPTVPTPDLEALKARALETNFTSDVMAYQEALVESRPKALDPAELDRRLDARFAAQHKQRTENDIMARLNQEYDAALLARKADFDSTGDGEAWVADAKDLALAEMARKGSTVESVIARVHAVADRAKKLVARATPATTPDKPKARKRAPTPVPTGATPAPVDPFSLPLRNADGTENRENEALQWAAIEKQALSRR